MNILRWYNSECGHGGTNDGWQLSWQGYCLCNGRRCGEFMRNNGQATVCRHKTGRRRRAIRKSVAQTKSRFCLKEIQLISMPPPPPPPVCVPLTGFRLCTLKKSHTYCADLHMVLGDVDAGCRRFRESYLNYEQQMIPRLTGCIWCHDYPDVLIWMKIDNMIGGQAFQLNGPHWAG